MREVLKKFGRYFLLDQIAAGGMAEIYRARDASGDGPARLLAIKRIHSGHGNDSEDLKMFRAEINGTMGFTSLSMNGFGVMPLIDGQRPITTSTFGALVVSWPNASCSNTI